MSYPTHQNKTILFFHQLHALTNNEYNDSHVFLYTAYVCMYYFYVCIVLHCICSVDCVSRVFKSTLCYKNFNKRSTEPADEARFLSQI